MGRTKKVGFTGKYGVRYGRSIRERLLKVGSQKKYRCPFCMKTTVRREASGIWMCKKCGFKFAGKAYKPW
ncbi:MAG TPA: 50S ribosomal protein L37ae [Candidatus Aenigmarchaeota archaeon]|nr:50S ribosomal protein L37ae [Candidatus Aenigmarchaeota archaeon]